MKMTQNLFRTIVEYIDIDSDSDFFISNSYNSMCRRLIDKILFIQNKYLTENRINFDRIYVPHTILNILADFSNFYTNGVNLTENNPVCKIGGLLDVYVSHSMNRNQILFSFDKKLVRDKKITNLLDGEFNPNFQEVILEIKSEFLL
jgi:hypothetical protein